MKPKKILEMYQRAMTQARKAPAAAFYVNKLVSKLGRNAWELNPQEKIDLLEFIKEYFPYNDSVTLDVLVMVGAPPRVLAERMVRFIPEAAKDTITKPLPSTIQATGFGIWLRIPRNHYTIRAG